MKSPVPIAGVLAATFSYSVALAATSEEQQACMGDAFRVCSSAIPNGHQVYLCLLNNREKLSSGCKEIMRRERSIKLRGSAPANNVSK